MTDAVVDLLEVLVAEVRGLRADLRGYRGDVATDDERFAVLLPLIAAYAGPRSFNGAELVQHAGLPEAEPLRRALVDAFGLDGQARRLGKALQRVQGRVIGGYVVRREGADREGAIWSVARVRV